MGILILTGPPATGKNTIAAAFARRCARCAVIDVDLVRWMVLQPHRAPWDGVEGRQQHQLGIRNACLLARNFVANDFTVVILDIVSDETIGLYRDELRDSAPQVVLLLPTYAEIQRRAASRPPRITAAEILALYRDQEALSAHDHLIDNSRLAPDEVADELALL